MYEGFLLSYAKAFKSAIRLIECPTQSIMLGIDIYETYLWIGWFNVSQNVDVSCKMQCCRFLGVGSFHVKSTQGCNPPIWFWLIFLPQVGICKKWKHAKFWGSIFKRLLIFGGWKIPWFYRFGLIKFHFRHKT